MGRLTFSVVQSTLPGPALPQRTLSSSHQLYKLFTALWTGNLFASLVEQGASEPPLPLPCPGSARRGRVLGSWAAPPKVGTEVVPSSTEVVDVASTVSASRSCFVSASRSYSVSALTGPPAPTTASTSVSTFSPAVVLVDAHTVVPDTTLGQISAKAWTAIDRDAPADATATNNNDVLQRVETSSEQLRKPIVKVLLYGTGGEGVCSPADVKYFRRICRDVMDVKADNIRVHLGGGKVGEEFEWFFSPENIVSGDVLILLVSGHASYGLRGGVALQLQTPEGIPIDTLVLHEAISKLPAYCTLEVVLGTCHSEAVISGLHQLWVANSSPTAGEAPSTDVLDIYQSPSGSRCGNHSISVHLPANPQSWTTRADACPPVFRSLLFQVNPTTIRAAVVVWAAAVKGGFAYPEATPSGKQGKHCTMIGAMCKALAAGGPNITRRALSTRIGEAAKRENTARKERDLTKTAEELARLGPRVQVPLLLGSINSPNSILDGYVFQPLSSDYPGPRM